MNYKQVLKASKHNPAGVNDVLEGLGRVCNKCKGSGMFAAIVSCSKCKGEGKLPYSWTPQVGEWCLYRSECALVVKYWPVTTANKFDSIEVVFPQTDKIGLEERVNQFVPILPWEEIERVLEKAGYWLEMNRPLSKYLKKNTMRVGCSIYQTGKLNYIVYAQGRSRQEAVMKAVLALGKELK